MNTVWIFYAVSDKFLTAAIKNYLASFRMIRLCANSLYQQVMTKPFTGPGNTKP